MATRSVQVEVTLDNKSGSFLPGSYVEVGLPLSGAAKALLLSPNTLQFRQDGPRVAVVEDGDKVVIREVKLGRDLGRAVEVIAGITSKDVVILNPPDTIEEGERVLARKAPEPPAEKKSEKKPQGGKGSKA